MSRMKGPNFIATVDLGYTVIDIETTSNNIGDPMVELREGGYSLNLTVAGALMLGQALKTAAMAKEK